MSPAVSVRLDEPAERALRTLQASGLSRSEAIRAALIASAERLRRRADLAEESKRLEADDADRTEMRAVAAMMEALRGPG